MHHASYHEKLFDFDKVFQLIVSGGGGKQFKHNIFDLQKMLLHYKIVMRGRCERLFVKEVGIYE